MDIQAIRKDFPILSRKINGKPLIYFDNAATSQKPKQVIGAISDYYRQHNANVHRGIHTLAEEATKLYEEARKKVARLINARSEKEIILTRNATEAINLVAYAWGRKNIGSNDEIVTTVTEHHANLIPWQQLCREAKASLKFLDINENGLLELDKLENLLTRKTKLVAVSWVSNVLGTINPVKEIAEIAHGKGALVLIDGAQRAPHMPIDVQKEGFDFLAFTGHKMLAPMGIGVLWAREEILEEMTPFLSGGEMIKKATLEEATFNELPWKFEAGTPNVGGAIGLGAAVDYLTEIGLKNIRDHEVILTQYALESLSKIKGLKIYGPSEAEERGGVISFSVDDIHPHDLATVLDQEGIAIRSGHHCAMPLHNRLGLIATARVSFYLYNTKEEIDRLVEGVEKVKKIFKP